MELDFQRRGEENLYCKLPDPPGWGLDRGLTTPYRKSYLFQTLNQRLGIGRNQDEQGNAKNLLGIKELENDGKTWKRLESIDWGGHGPEKGQEVIG